MEGHYCGWGGVWGCSVGGVGVGVHVFIGGLLLATEGFWASGKCQTDVF